MIRSYLRRKLHDLHFIYRPALACTPAPDRVDRRYTKAPQTDTDTIVTPYGQTQKYSVKEADTVTHEWAKVDKQTNYGKRTMILNMQDMAVLHNRKLDTDKAAAIKQKWGSGLSIAEAVNALQSNGRGYRKRTVAEYYSAFSHALTVEVMQ